MEISQTSDGSPYEKRVDAKGRVLSDGCIAGEMPFEELPEGWAWARLENLCSIITDGDHQAPPQQADGVPFLVISDVSSGELDFSNTRHVSIDYFNSLDDSRKPCRGDLLLTVTGSFGIPVPVDTEENFCFQRHIALLRPLSCRKFMANILLAPSTYEYFKAKATGTAQKTVSLSCLRSTLLALPPESEQQRIVGKLAKLMPLVEEYGRFEDAREELDAALPGRLRKSVLQMVVQGKLVPQDPADEPASALLERIREQRCQLAAEKKMKATKGGESVIFTGSDGRRYEKRIDAKGRESEPVCIEDEIPFEIPEGWGWARLESVTTYIQRGKSPRYSTVKKHPVVAQKCNQWSGFSLEKAKFIDPETVCKYGSERILRDGDLLWNSTGLGTLGRMAIYDSSKNEYGWAVADSHVTVIRTREDWLNYRFAFAYFAGPSVQSVIEDRASGSTKQKELAQETVKNYLIPIPPLAEQCRIVTQLEAVLSQVTNQ